MKKIFVLLLLAINASVFSQELITNNGSFTKGLASWQFGVASYDEDIPDAGFEIVKDSYDDHGGSCKIRVKLDTPSGNYNDTYLMYRKLNIRKGKGYRVSFYIKSSMPDDKVLISVGSGTPPDLQILEDREYKFKGDSKWKRISFTFEARRDKPNVDFSDISLFFGFNHRRGNFYIDNISFKPL